jgi:hypothetical protein
MQLKLAKAKGKANLQVSSIVLAWKGKLRKLTLKGSSTGKTGAPRREFALDPPLPRINLASKWFELEFFSRT